MPAGGTLAELQAEVVELTGDHAVFTGRWEQIAQAQDHRRPIFLPTLDQPQLKKSWTPSPRNEDWLKA